MAIEQPPIQLEPCPSCEHNVGLSVFKLHDKGQQRTSPRFKATVTCNWCHEFYEDVMPCPEGTTEQSARRTASQHWNEWRAANVAADFRHQPLCENCAHFDAKSETCHSHPPVSVRAFDDVDGREYSRSEWPRVYDDDWCGEWVERGTGMRKEAQR